jgi:predicted nucleic acid-binding protein
LDTNILVYAYQSSEPEKQITAMARLRAIAKLDSVISGQILSEFLNTAHKKHRVSLDLARQTCQILRAEFIVIEQCIEDRVSASKLAEARQIQFYDALLISTLSRCGVTTLLSEDMSDGETYGGVTILNPFNPANTARIEAALL